MRSSLSSFTLVALLGFYFVQSTICAQWKLEIIPTEKGAVYPLWCNGLELCYAQGIKAKNQDGTWLEKWERHLINTRAMDLPFQISMDWMRQHQATEFICLTEMGVIFSKYAFPDKKAQMRLYFWDGHEEILIPTGKHTGDDMHPAWDKGTQTLFFSSNRAGGKGGFDIYRMHFKEGQWSEVAALQGDVNSLYDERFCAVYNGDLYFSTKTELGDLDIFKSPLEGAWTMKWQLEAPVNSGWDDFQWVPYDEGWGGLVSNRNQEGSQLFFLNRQYAQRKVCLFGTKGASVEVQGVEVNSKMIVLNESSSCIEIPIEKKLKFILRDSIGDLIPFGFLLVRDEYGRSLAQGIMNQWGEWEWSYLPFQFGAMSLLQWKDESLLAFNQKSPNEWSGATVGNLTGVIYFDNSSMELKQEHLTVLDEWAIYLMRNPFTKIQIKGFADAKGKDDFNEQLALSRAMKAQDYLISKGVSISQLDMDFSGKASTKQWKQERKVTLSILP